MNLSIRPSVNVIGQNRTAQQNPQNQAFGMYVEMKPAVAQDLMEKAERLDTEYNHINNIVVNAGHLVQRVYRDIINHNIEPKNHAIYDDIAEITKIIPTFESKKFTGFLLCGEFGGTKKTPRCGSFGVDTDVIWAPYEPKKKRFWDIFHLNSPKKRLGAINFYPNDTNLASEIQNQIIFRDRFGGREKCVLNHLAEQAAKTLPKDISPKLPRLWDDGPIYNPKDL